MLKEDEQAVIISINGDENFQTFLLTQGISVGSIITKNYSPGYSGLINLTVSGKMLSLKKSDFLNLGLVKLQP